MHYVTEFAREIRQCVVDKDTADILEEKSKFLALRKFEKEFMDYNRYLPSPADIPDLIEVDLDYLEYLVAHQDSDDLEVLYDAELLGWDGDE